MKGLSNRFMNISSLIMLTSRNSDSSIVSLCVCFNKKNSGWPAIAEMQSAKSVFASIPWLILINYKALYFTSLLSVSTFSRFSPLSSPRSQPCFSHCPLRLWAAALWDSMFRRLQPSRAQEAVGSLTRRPHASSVHSFTLWMWSWHSNSCHCCQREK